MRISFTVGALISVATVAAVAAVAWAMQRGPTDAESARIREVLRDPAPPTEPTAYAHCASCHLHDGSGRPDGSIPKLNGGRSAVLRNKLARLRADAHRIPVMAAFARTLEPAEIAEISDYLESLADTPGVATSMTNVERLEGAVSYATHCAACHGDHGEGNDALLAPRLCGQYEGYLGRRLLEIAAGTRGPTDGVMGGVLAGIPSDELGPTIAWLSEGKGCAPP